MTARIRDFVELLNAEQHVQVDKLRDHARHGISAKVRGEVWMYLLSVLSPDRISQTAFLSSLDLKHSDSRLHSSLPSQAVSNIQRKALVHHTRRFYNPTYAGLITSLTAETPDSPPQPSRPNLNSHSHHSSSNPSPHDQSSQQVQDISPAQIQTTRSEYALFLPPPPHSPPTRHDYLSTLEEVLGRYWYEEQTAESKVGEGEEKNWVYLATPFVCCYTSPVAVFLAFQKLMERMRSFPPMSYRLASLLTLFRQSQPELFSYFEDEQVRYVEIASSWLTTMLSKEMWLGDVLRLWDSYLASDDMFSLHCYVCVAILGTCKETLEELDGSEAKLMLLDLPPMDVDRLLQDAANLRVSFPLPMPASDE